MRLPFFPTLTLFTAISCLSASAQGGAASHLDEEITATPTAMSTLVTWPSQGTAASPKAPDLQVAMPATSATLPSPTSPTSPTDNLKQIFWTLSKLDDRLLRSPANSPCPSDGNTSKGAKALTNYIFSVRGFDMSRDGANLALGETGSLKGKSAETYGLQCTVDEQHLQMVSQTLSLAAALGATNKDEATITSSFASLQAILDGLEKNEADRILQSLGNVSLSEAENLPTVSHTWQLSDIRAKKQIIVEAALARDPVTAVLKERLQPYNHRSNGSQKSARVINPALTIAGMSPTILAPIAGISQMTYVMANGGPEQDKLLDELYLAKGLEHRHATINEEAHLVMDSLLVSCLTGNQTLFKCAAAFVEHIAGAKALTEILHEPSVSNTELIMYTDSPNYVPRGT